MELINFFVFNKEAIEVLSYLATLLGIPSAIVAYLLQKRKEQIEREHNYYESLNERYIKYLELCLENEKEDVFDVSKNNSGILNAGLSIKQLILYTILVSMLEAAFIKYPQLHEKVRKTQGEGWFKYMEGWAMDDKFRKAWTIIGNQFESRFVSHMNKLINK